MPSPTKKTIARRQASLSVVLLTTLLIVGSGSVGIAAKSESFSANLSSWPSYVNLKHGFEIKVPPGYSVYELQSGRGLRLAEEDSESLLGLYVAPDGSSKLSEAIPISLIAGPTEYESVEEMMRAEKATLLRSGAGRPRVSDVSFRTISLNGSDGLEVSFGDPRRSVMLCFLRGGSKLRVVFGLEGELSALAASVASTFRLLK